MNEAVLRQWQQREAAMQQDIVAMSQECRKHQLNSQDLANQLGAARSKLDEMQALKDKEVDGLYGEIDALTTQLALKEREATQRRIEDQDSSSRGLATEIEMQNEIDSLQEVLDATRKELQRIQSLYNTSLNANSKKHTREEPHTDTPAVSAVVYEDQLKALQRSESQLSQLKQQIEALQADLLGAQTEASALRDELAKQRSKEHALKQENLALEKELRQLMISANASANPPAEKKAFDLASVVSGEKHGGEVSSSDARTDETLNAIANQRDRYRARLVSLEETSMQEIDNLKLQIFSLTQENEQLHQYMRNGSQSAPAFAVRIPGSSSHGGSSIARTSLLDRAATLLTRFIITNEHTRRLFLVYLLSLHGFVFLVLMSKVAMA